MDAGDDRGGGRRSVGAAARRPRRAALAALLLLAGCAVLRAAPPVHTYRLDYPPPAAIAAAGSGILRIAPFTIAALYDQAGFVYRDDRYAIAADSYHRWLAPPAAMITNLFSRDLAASKLFAAVLSTPSALSSTYELSGVIDELEERPAAGCTAHIALRAVLIGLTGAGRREVRFEQLFAADEPCTRGDPASFAEAMSRAVQRVSLALIEAIAAALRA